MHFEGANILPQTTIKWKDCQIDHRQRFYFPGISLGVTHSPKIEKSVFPPKKWGEKQLFFIFSIQFVSHSLKFFETLYFLKENPVWLVFFRRLLAGFLFCFFPWKSLLSLTHSFEKAVFFSRPPDKKRVFHSLTRFCRKNPK